MRDLSLSSLYYSSSALVSKDINKKEKKIETSKKSSFASMVNKKEEIEELLSAGLPVEIAGLDVEEAFVYLQDEMDRAGENLVNNICSESFTKYRKSVSNFLKYFEKHNFDVSKTKRIGVSRRRGTSPFFAEKRPRDPYVQIQVIDERLNEVAYMLLQNHADKLSMLAKVDEIKGLIVDFFAA